MGFYLKNFQNEKFLYVDDETICEVDRMSFAEKYESKKAAESVRKILLSQFPMLDVVDQYNCPT